MAPVRYYPMFMDLAGKPCLVVGAGSVAARKARTLLACGARVTVVGERPAAAFRALERRGLLLRARRFRAGDVGGKRLVVAATDDPAVNAAVAAACRRRGVPVNAADDPPNCDFILPSVLERGDLVVAVSTGGRSPAAARLVRERIAEAVGPEYADLVRLLGAERDRMRQGVPEQRARAAAWGRALGSGALEALRGGDPAAARRAVRRCVEEAGPQGRAGKGRT